jgi:hypothetical protein
MPEHTHEFVETYDGLVGFGMDRETDEKTIWYYLQKFSDDGVMQKMLPQTSDEDLERIFELVTELLKKHLTEPEYHRLFLKEEHHH